MATRNEDGSVTLSAQEAAEIQAGVYGHDDECPLCGAGASDEDGDTDNPEPHADECAIGALEAALERA